MKKAIRTMLAGLVISMAAGAAQANCDFFEHINRGGEKLILKDGECGVLVDENIDGCEGLAPKFIEGWNDRISSVELHHNSTAILKKDIGADSQAMTVKGNRGVAEVGDMNDQASILLCRQ